MDSILGRKKEVSGELNKVYILSVRGAARREGKKNFREIRGRDKVTYRGTNIIEGIIL